MLEYGFYLLGVVALLAAPGNWRAAIYLCIILDVLRDPVRKIVEGHSVLFTQSVNLVWLVIALSVLIHERRRIVELRQDHPQLFTAAQLLFLALVPGAILSALNYDGGWLLALLGAASYLAMLPGALIGYAFARHERDVLRFMAVYCLANGLAMVGGLVEYLKVDLPGLGGMEMVWLRNQTGYSVELISGFYRSPDLLGLHAAMVCTFAVVLAMMAKKEWRPGWYSLAMWAAFCLLLCGRRKMIAIPFVFAASFIFLQYRGRSRTSRIAWSVLFSMFGIALVFAYADEFGLSPTYEDYASTLLTEGLDRTHTSFVSSPLSTVSQSGLLGRGLGTVTQGNYHLVGGRMGWQEDGVGRAFAELGVLGVVILGIAVVIVARRCRAALKMVPPRSSTFILQAGLFSVVIANIASFAISHQAYSGDPSSVCMVLMCLGIALSLPRRFHVAMPARRVSLHAARSRPGWSMK